MEVDGTQFPLNGGGAPALDSGFVSHYLAVQFVYQFVNGGVKVKVLAASMQRIAFDVNAAFGTLAALFLRFVVLGEQHPDMDDLVKVAQYALQFGDNVGAQRGAYFEMVATDG